MSAEVNSPGSASVALAGEPLLQFKLLLAVKCRSLLNRMDQAISVSPFRAFLSCNAVAFVWVSLYLLFRAVLVHMHATPLENLITQKFVFDFFFVLLFFMLVISNAIIGFGGLFGSEEPAFLLSAPLHPLAVVLAKYIETLILSSWSLLLLGLPLMVAYGQVYDQPPLFYLLFCLNFVLFTLIPGAIGLLLAFMVAYWFPRSIRKLLWALGVAVVMIAAVPLFRLWQERDASDDFIVRVYGQLSLVRSSLLPSSWVSNGLAASADNNLLEGLRYLAILAANGLFIGWMSVLLIANMLYTAYDRQQSVSGSERAKTGWLSAMIVRLVFFVLPARSQAMVLKDFRTFFRDPSQWLQMLIFFGLLAIYTINIQNLPLDLSNPSTRHLVAFLNLTSIALILATFTSRFIFPLVSAETMHMWLLAPSPMPRGSILWTKWGFSFVLACLLSVPLTIGSSEMLMLEREWMWLQIGWILLVAAGLTSCATGLGARFIVTGQRHGARIASGFGGTLNLVISMTLVVALVGSYGLAALAAVQQGEQALAYALRGPLPAAVIVTLGASVACMGIGQAHFNQREF